MSVRLDWDAMAAEAAAILTCPHCSSEAQDGMPPAAMGRRAV